MGKELKKTAISRDALANLVGLSPRRISQLVAEGVIPKLAHGKYDGETAVQAYIAFVGDRAKKEQSADELDLLQERARKTHAEANIAELEEAQMRGRLVDMADLTDALEAIVSEVRAKLLNHTPTRIDARAKSMKKTETFKAIVKDEIAQALAALSSVDPNSLVQTK